MNAVILMVSICMLSAGNSFLQKKFQLNTSETLMNFAFYNFANAFLACGYFFVASGFNININVSTMIFSAMFAVVVCLSLVIGICILSRVQIATASIISSSGNIIVSSVFGIIYFGEHLTVKLVCAIIMMLFAAIIPLKFSNSDPQKRSSAKSKLIICILSFFLAGAANIVSKLYAENPHVTDTVSFFFWTNVILVAASFSVIVFVALKNHIAPKTVIKTFTPKQLGNVAMRTAMSNISSVLTVSVLSMMNVSLYTVLTSALGIIVSALMSLFFKEQMKLRNWISVALAITAGVILNV